MTKKKHLQQQPLIKLIVSILLVIVGISVIAWVARSEDPRLWIGAVLVLLGALALPGATQSEGGKTPQSTILVGVTIMVQGAYLILRDLGVISIPVLGYGLGSVLIGVGLYGAITAYLATRASVLKDTVADKQATKK